MPPDGALPVEIEVGQPRGHPHQGRAASVDGVGEARAVRRPGEAHLLLHSPDRTAQIRVRPVRPAWKCHGSGARPSGAASFPARPCSAPIPTVKRSPKRRPATRMPPPAPVRNTTPEGRQRAQLDRGGRAGRRDRQAPAPRRDRRSARTLDDRCGAPGGRSSGHEPHPERACQHRVGGFAVLLGRTAQLRGRERRRTAELVPGRVVAAGRDRGEPEVAGRTEAGCRPAASDVESRQLRSRRGRFPAQVVAPDDHPHEVERHSPGDRKRHRRESAAPLIARPGASSTAIRITTIAPWYTYRLANRSSSDPRPSPITATAPRRSPAGSTAAG